MAGFNNDRNWKILAAVRAVAAETGATPVGVSLAWLLAQPQVSACIFGARSLAQLEENVKASDVVLSAEQVARLEEASRFDLGYPYAFMKDVQGRW
jgi:aryl-alcohol dehydrogenase-like predicted oxidoreductase